MNEAVEKLVNSNEHLKYDEELSKVVCTLTGHEMPLNEAIIEKYINGKKFDKANVEFLYKQYSNYLTKTKDNQIYCKLTNRFMSLRYKDLHNHINGFSFLKAAEKWIECKAENKEFKPINSGRKRDKSKLKKMLKNENGNANEDEDAESASENDSDNVEMEDGSENDSELEGDDSEVDESEVEEEDDDEVVITDETQENASRKRDVVMTPMDVDCPPVKRKRSVLE